VAVDGTPPVALIHLPAEGGYVKEPAAVTGTATDRHLADWTLEFAPGDAVSAFQWSPLGTGDDAVEDGPLADWIPLPQGSTRCASVVDRVGQTTVALRTVTVDTTPPAPRPPGR
jgi:hypothetical protein